MDRMATMLRAALVTSLVIKLLLWGWIITTDPMRFWDRDTASYVQPARALVEHGVFAIDAGRPDEPETSRTPGYPSFLAVSFFLFGERLAGTVLLQLLLSVGTLILLASLARTAFVDGWVATVAVWIAVCDLVSLAFSQMLLTETLFTFVLVAAALAGVRTCRDADRMRWAVTAGLLLGLAALVRPIGYYLPLPFALMLGLVGGASANRRVALRLSVACLVPALLLIGAWQLRNYTATGTWVFSRIIQKELGQRAAQMERQVVRIESQDAPNTPPVGTSRSDRGDDSPAAGSPGGAQRLLRYPVLLLRTTGLYAVRVMTGPGEHRLIRLLGYAESDAPGLDLRRVLRVPGQIFIDTYGDQQLDADGFLDKWVRPPRWPLLPFSLAALHLAVLNLGLLLWLFRVIRARRCSGPELMIVTIVCYFLLVSYPSSRFRVPIMPFASMLAAAGLLSVRRNDG